MYKVVYNVCFGGFGLSKTAIKWLKDKGLDVPLYGDREIPRHDPLLVECVETLGDEACGDFADLCVKTISENMYYIDEYDGSESVVTPNSMRASWIKIDGCKKEATFATHGIVNPDTFLDQFNLDDSDTE